MSTFILFSSHWSYSIPFNPIWSYFVPFDPYHPLWSYGVHSVLFSPLWSYSVHVGPIQFRLVLFGPYCISTMEFRRLKSICISRCIISVHFAKKKKKLFLFHTPTFTKHPHQFVYSTHLFNKIFILDSIPSHHQRANKEKREQQQSSSQPPSSTYPSKSSKPLIKIIKTH